MRRDQVAPESDERLFVWWTAVRFRRRDETGRAGEWWRAVAEYPHGAPGIVRELPTPSVVCDPTEAEQALALAEAHPAWVDDPPPLVVDDPDS